MYRQGIIIFKSEIIITQISHVKLLVLKGGHQCMIYS